MMILADSNWIFWQARRPSIRGSVVPLDCRWYPQRSDVVQGQSASPNRAPRIEQYSYFHTSTLFKSLRHSTELHSTVPFNTHKSSMGLRFSPTDF